MMVAMNRDLAGLGIKPAPGVVLDQRFLPRPATTTTAVRVPNDPRFTDPKLNAMRQAAVAGDWRRLFSIAPRGCVGPDGPTMSDGSRGRCGDDPSIPLGSPQGQAAYDYWHGKNPMRKNLTLQDLRVYADESGRVRTKQLSPDEIRDFFNNYQWARHDWQCTRGQLDKYIHDAIGGRLIYPLAQCAKSSASRRRKILKKAAVVAAAATGGVLLGKAIIGKVGGALAGKGGAAAATGAAAKGVATGATAIAKGAGAVATTAAKALPVAASVINSTRTAKAVAKGEIPPPPISIGDGNFSDYANLVAEQLAHRELARQTSKAEQEMLQRYVELERRRMATVEPRHRPVVNTGLNPALTEAQKERADTAIASGDVWKMAAIGVPLVLLLARSM